MDGVGGGKVEVVQSKGCSKLVVGVSSPLSSIRSIQSLEPMSPTSSSLPSEPVTARSTAPFAGLVICVTGLSKEATEQVMEATERLGGQYSTNLHPRCTHLVVQGFGGRKFEHALKHGSKNGLFVVTFGWFVDSVRSKVRLSESLYSVQNCEENGTQLDELNRLTGFSGTENSCFTVVTHGAKRFDIIKKARCFGREFYRGTASTLSGHSVYIDPDISAELRNKVVETVAREGAKLVEQWFVGSSASHVVCEGTSIQRYLGHSSNIITPLWVLKTAKEKYVQRFVHMSADLARQVGMMLEDSQNGITGKETNEQNVPEDDRSFRNKASLNERQHIVKYAKIGVRNRRNRRMQVYQTLIRPITPISLLDSICWSISEPTSTASISTFSFNVGCTSEPSSSVFRDAKGDSEASLVHLTQPLTEREKSELIFKYHFLTILFPIDRFGEMGPSSRTFFSNNGFTCMQVLDHIYEFYQENMCVDEIEVAIHTDSRRANQLRTAYSSIETAECGYVVFKRIDFLGSRKIFEMLKRVSGDYDSNVYELLLRA